MYVCIYMYMCVYQRENVHMWMHTRGGETWTVMCSSNTLDLFDEDDALFLYTPLIHVCI